jgi:hypothetical protein
MLLHDGAPLSFWPDVLATATYLLNRWSCRTCNDLTPYQLLLSVPPDYSYLRVFGCRCYPNTITTALHKLSTDSLPCIFLGYPADTKGYRCYDPESRRVLTSRHVHFDESYFPFRLLNSPRSASNAVPAVPTNTILVCRHMPTDNQLRPIVRPFHRRHPLGQRWVILPLPTSQMPLDRASIAGRYSKGPLRHTVVIYTRPAPDCSVASTASLDGDIVTYWHAAAHPAVCLCGHNLCASGPFFRACDSLKPRLAHRDATRV